MSDDSFALQETNFSLGNRYQGKVRDCYDLGKFLLLLSSDRVSAFDRVLTTIPHKGRILNLLSAWWFEETHESVPNHLLAVVDARAMLVKKCRVFPVEFIMRGFLTGSTQTSMWTLYQKGEREFGGIRLPDGMLKNQKLPQAILTPTTKAHTHDQPATAQEIIRAGWMTAEEWQQAADYAQLLFHLGSEKAREKGLILVDTKYEFGVDEQGRVVLVDELHTPDSSRYWLLDQQTNTFEHYDKEWLRLRIAAECDPYQVETITVDDVVRGEVSRRYQIVYELLTGKRLVVDNAEEKPEHFEMKLKRRIASYL